MAKLTVYDPPMCCSSGVCGASVDQAVIRFAADLDWARGCGVAVERYNLAQQPHAFVENDAVHEALMQGGSESLPLVLVDGRVVARGAYPSRQELAVWLGVEVSA